MEQGGSSLEDVRLARDEGREDDALRLLTTRFDHECRSDHGNPQAGASHFGTMFEWGCMAADYAPARVALAMARDGQVRLLLAGDQRFGTGNKGWPQTRFEVIADINKLLDETRATYELFVQIEQLLPALARRRAGMALPAIVEAGDFALAERYLPQPLRQLDDLNRWAGEMPLFPIEIGAPRLASELMNFATDVRLCNAILGGLGRLSEAEALCNAALTGLDSDEMRALTQREIAAPGTITNAIVENQMALHEGGDST